LGESCFEVPQHLSDDRVALGIQELLATPFLVPRNQPCRRDVSRNPLHTIGEVESGIELLESGIGHVPAAARRLGSMLEHLDGNVALHLTRDLDGNAGQGEMSGDWEKVQAPYVVIVS
jgi:hypothetical protein